MADIPAVGFTFASQKSLSPSPRDVCRLGREGLGDVRSIGCYFLTCLGCVPCAQGSPFETAMAWGVRPHRAPMAFYLRKAPDSVSRFSLGHGDHDKAAPFLWRLLRDSLVSRECVGCDGAALIALDLSTNPTGCSDAA